MLKDCVEIFRETRQKYINEDESHNKISFITDDYPLSNGSYLLIDKESGKLKKHLEVNKNTEDYEEFPPLDYLSKLIDMNKPIDGKKTIHSNNIYSFFVKKESLGDKLTEDKIDGYYNVLLKPQEKYKKDKSQLKIYTELEDKYGKVCENEVNFIKNWIKINLIEKDIFETYPEIKKDKNYLKIFFDFPLESYKKESEKYILPNIYNSAKYNVNIENTIYGLPNNNMNLNDKKQFLKNVTRKNTQPYLINCEDVLDQNYFFDYLNRFLNRRENNIYLSLEDGIKGYKDFPTNFKSSYFLRVNKGTEPEIVDVELIKEKTINLSISNKDLFNLPYKDYTPDCYKLIEDEKVLQGIVNEVFYEKCLIPNYFTPLKDINLPKFVTITSSILGQSKNIWEHLFFKKNDALFNKEFKKIALKIIKNTILNNKTIKNYEFKACEQFSLYISISNYIEKMEENMEGIINKNFNSLNEKINSNVTKSIESDEEYFLAIGQLTKYFISLSKSADKKHSLVNPIINCKNTEKLKDELQKLFKKYNYEIDSNSKRFNNLYGMILAYNCSSKINEKYLMAGYLFNSLIYFKEEK